MALFIVIFTQKYGTFQCSLILDNFIGLYKLHSLKLCLVFFGLGNFKIFQNESFYTFSTTIDHFMSTEYCMIELEYSYTFKVL